MNFTLQNLMHSNIVSLSPFLTQSHRFSHSSLSVSSFFISRSFQTFLYSSSSNKIISILNSAFSRHLHGVIHLSQEEISGRKDGGLSFYGSSKVNVDSTIFVNNTNIFLGGAIYCISQSTTTQITSCTFTNNSAKYGGAIFIMSYGGTAIIQNSDF